MNIFVYKLTLKYYVATLSHTRPPILIHYLLLTLSYIPPWGLGGGGGGGGGVRLTSDEQDHPLERAITIMLPRYHCRREI